MWILCKTFDANFVRRDMIRIAVKSIAREHVLFMFYDVCL